VSLGLHISGTARIAGTPVFDGLDLDLVPGGWTCLLGPSGVGKTTVLRLIAGLDYGVTFEGRIAASDGGPLQGRIALMAQSDLLLPWRDVLGNVTLGAALRGERAERDRAREIIARVGLTEHIHKFPDTLSGGQRQRVALARTLMEDRPFVLLDEPFSALDARTRAQMQELTVELLSGRTVLLVTHDPAEAARLGHRIVIMTETGVGDFPPPPAPVPRPIDDMDTLRAQAQLLARLREPA